MKKITNKFSTSQIILLGFLSVIAVGTLLLMLPISSTSGESVPFTTALFTATTSTCVTGLVVVPTVSWSFFGQAIILLLVQIGGMGVVTIMSGFFIMLNRKIGLENRLLLQDAFNLNSLSGLVTFTKKVILGTLFVEALGAILYMFVFIPQFGLKGVWISIFNSVSAFCNAGLDIIGENSLYDYVENPIVNIVTMVLIVLGGLGFIVWWDIALAVKSKLKGKKKVWRRLTLQSKIVISTTLILIFSGALFFLIFEGNKAISDMSFPQKLMTSLFQSVTTRTAGFATLPQENLSTASTVLSMILMFIGGSPVGTAGGIKTVTFAVLFFATLSMIKGKNDVSIFGRSITKSAISKCIAITFISSTIIIVSTVLLSCVSDKQFMDILFEIVSANATVGLSRNLTASLTSIGRYIVILTMFFGRVGPISLAVSFNIKKQNENLVKEPTEEISVG